MLLNIDVGELEGEDEELYRLADLVNVACGGHAGDLASMERAAVSARAHGASLGAHPSFPDRPGFGRRAMQLAPDELRATLAAQLEALASVAARLGVAVAHVKPHGALYHAASSDRAVAEVIVEVSRARLGRPAIVGARGSRLLDVARDAGLVAVTEGFADRGMLPGGELVPRGEPGALLDDDEAVVSQVKRLAREGAYETVCVHGDGPRALETARLVRKVLDA